VADRAAAEGDAIRQVAARLVRQFPELPAAEVEHAVYGKYGTFEGSAVSDFVPVLVERASRQHLAEQRSQQRT
jgi:hypothetical protein